MSEDFKESVKKRFEAYFGLERLPLFADTVSRLEKAGHSATAKVLKELLQDNAAQVLEKKLNRES
ncbi:MAG: hypothetical protein HQ494_13295 [Rhodospirillales bacterium]|nr:hypothetical protein [Rhodospirillales bacterium]